MIGPKELRLGNYVKAGGVAAPVIDINRWMLGSPESQYRVFVEAKSPDSGKTMQCGGWCESIDPIPITDAVLEACGFERCEEHFRLMISDEYGDIYLAPLKDGEFGIGENNRCRHRLEFLTYTIHCSALHHLQNLYYALTGKDLEIDETKLEAAIAKADIV